MIWSGKQLSEILGAECLQSLSTGPVQFNSKDVSKGDLFIALKGNNDGHIYASEAIEAGAAAVIVSRAVEDIPVSKMIVVPDTFEALLKLAEYKRANSKAKYIAVTGSVGKTGTKEAIKLMLSAFGKVFASRGNFNNYLGTLINLASQPDDLDYVVLELGMNHAGELTELSSLVRPHIAIVTNVSEAHLEFFDSVYGIVDAKCEIFSALKPSGAAIINKDSPYYEHMSDNIGKYGIKQVYNFGTQFGSNSRLVSYNVVQDGFVDLIYMVNFTEITITIPLIPRHYAENFAAAFMVVATLNLDPFIAAKKLYDLELMKGRGRIIKFQNAGKPLSIISDYYNANPASMIASLQYLKQLPGVKKAAIIGDMLELGSTSGELHNKLVPFILDSGIQKLLLVGEQTRNIERALDNKVQTMHFDNVDSLIKEFDNLIEGGELMLIKGSRGMRLDKIVSHLESQEQICASR